VLAVTNLFRTYNASMCDMQRMTNSVLEMYW